MRTRLAPTVVCFSLTLFAVQTEVYAELDPDPPARTDCVDSSEQAARVIDVGAITGVRDLEAAEVHLVYAPVSSVTIEGSTRAISDIRVANEDGLARLERGGCAQADPIRVTIAAPSFEDIAIKGKSIVRSLGAIRSATDSTIHLEDDTQATLSIAAVGEVVVFADGHGFHNLEINAASLIALHSGGGEMSIAGQTGAASLAELGRGTVATRQLLASHMVVDIAGSGTVTALR